MSDVPLIPPSGHPEPPPHDAATQRMELIISYILRAGVFVSLALIVIGSVVSFVRHPDYMNSREGVAHLTHPGHALVHNLDELVDGVLHGRGQAIVALGLVLLIVTPVFRVAVSVFGFMIQRDRVFVWVTALVLSLLILSFVLGKTE